MPYFSVAYKPNSKCAAGAAIPTFLNSNSNLFHQLQSKLKMSTLTVGSLECVWVNEVAVCVNLKKATVI